MGFSLRCRWTFYLCMFIEMGGSMKENIIRMAHEAGIVVTGEAVWKLCELVAAAEREACAKFAQEFLTRGRSPLGRAVGDAIRARGQT